MFHGQDFTNAIWQLHILSAWVLKQDVKLGKGSFKELTINIYLTLANNTILQQ